MSVVASLPKSKRMRIVFVALLALGGFLYMRNRGSGNGLVDSGVPATDALSSGAGDVATAGALEDPTGPLADLAATLGDLSTRVDSLESGSSDFGGGDFGFSDGGFDFTDTSGATDTGLDTSAGGPQEVTLESLLGAATEPMYGGYFSPGFDTLRASDLGGITLPKLDKNGNVVHPATPQPKRSSLVTGGFFQVKPTKKKTKKKTTALRTPIYGGYGGASHPGGAGTLTGTGQRSFGLAAVLSAARGFTGGGVRALPPPPKPAARSVGSFAQFGIQPHTIGYNPPARTVAPGTPVRTGLGPNLATGARGVTLL